MRKLHSNPNLYFLYNPKGHFLNALTLYSAMKKHVSKKYFGKKRKIDELKPLKGTAFEKCDLPYELFNINRRVKMNMK